MLKATWEEASAMGCVYDEAGFNGQMDQYDSDMCRICDEAAKECPAYMAYHTNPYLGRRAAAARKKAAITPKGVGGYPGMSIREISVKLNISMNEVRRRKATGTL